MPQIQPPNTQTLRPQHLAQVGHEGNPVETCDLNVVGVLDSPNYYSCDGADDGGPILYPATGTGGGGESSTPVIPLVAASSGDMDCSGSQSVTITVTGGVAPYTFATTHGVITPGGSGKTAALTPPVNANPSYSPASIAFGRVMKFQYALGCGGPCTCRADYFNCAGEQIQTCSGSNTDQCMEKCSAGWHCSGFNSPTGTDPTVTLTTSATCVDPGFTHVDQCAIAAHTTCSCDVRDATMQGNGCNPCDTSFDSAIVTVTDALGHLAYVLVERNVNHGGP